MNIWEILDGTALATAVRESLWVYPTIITFHTIGLAFLVGILVMTNLRLLGFARETPIQPLQKYIPIAMTGFL